MVLSSTTTCLLGCKADIRPLASTGAGSQYLQCQQCGLAFVPMPQSSSVHEPQYVEDFTSPVAYYQRTAKVDRLTFRRRLQLLAGLQPERGRLLDVGCSMGTLMGVAQELGWQVEGVEPNPKAANLAKEQGFKVHEGFLTPSLAQKLSGDYQCVVMSDVIEHLADPAEAIGLAKELLASAGLLLLSTPNLESFFCMKFQLKPMEHLFLFNFNNLRLFLEKEGLEIDRLEKTSRRRALGQLNHSTTELGVGLKGLTAVLCSLRLDGAFAWILDRFSKDELLVIARKN